MKPSQTSVKTSNHFNTLATELASKGVAVSAMFGMPTLAVNGKAFAGVFGDELVFKLTGEPHAEALALVGARLFDPSGTGRAMKEWVVVPAKHSSSWRRWAEAAVSFVGRATTGTPTRKASKGSASKPKKAKKP